MLKNERLSPSLQDIINSLSQMSDSLTKTKTLATVPTELKEKINNLIKDIGAKLPEPSYSEDNTTSMISVSLGEIRAQLNKIKNLTSKSQPYNLHFFKSSPPQHSNTTALELIPQAVTAIVASLNKLRTELGEQDHQPYTRSKASRR